MNREKTRDTNGFTLIELLVVIAVIALLLAIVVPVLRKVKAQARKAVCSSQLHQWGVALIAYGGDHNSRLPKTPGTNIGQLWPSMVVVDSENAYIKPYYAQGDFSLYSIGSYVAGYEKDTTTPSHSVYFCPEASEVYREMLIQHYVPRGYFHATYNYFGQVKSWAHLTPTPKTVVRDLADNLNSTGRKLMMADHFIKVSYSAAAPMVPGAWAYNHGLKGPSYLADLGSRVQYDTALLEPPAIAGTNNLFTDGSVDWKDRGDFNLDQIRGLSDDNGRIGWISSGNKWLMTTY